MELEELAQQGEADQKACRHTAPDDFSESAEGLTDLEQHQ